MPTLEVLLRMMKLLVMLVGVMGTMMLAGAFALVPRRRQWRVKRLQCGIFYTMSEHLHHQRLESQHTRNFSDMHCLQLLRYLLLVAEQQGVFVVRHGRL